MPLILCCKHLCGSNFGVLLLTSWFVSPTSCRSICVFDGFPSMIEEVPCGALFLLWNGSGLVKGFPVIPWVWMLFFDIAQALVGTVLVGPLLKSFPRS
ncbi:hypothetical protein Bca4012_049607 [Brassica carinata]|uniref:Uncharacterized protein n=1 Tax=Brassica carinata TaxID=52824 RepID=A0A8X7R653_BRACI|nr:hypothetical protein Bca52824_052360 [Brassica carinata]